MKIEAISASLPIGDRRIKHIWVHYGKLLWVFTVLHKIVIECEDGSTFIWRA